MAKFKPLNQAIRSPNPHSHYLHGQNLELEQCLKKESSDLSDNYVPNVCHKKIFDIFVLSKPKSQCLL